MARVFSYIWSHASSANIYFMCLPNAVAKKSARTPTNSSEQHLCI